MQPAIDLTGCDREPIRIPGSVQRHGFLLALAAGRDAIVQASANLPEFTGVAAADVIGRPLGDVIGAGNAASVQAELDKVADERQVGYVGTIELPGRGRFDVLAHRHDGLLVIECESVPRAAAADFRLLYTLIGNFFARLSDSDTIETMCRNATDEIRRLTGFGRVLVYRFDNEDHGHVVAETRDGQMPSFLGHRFPASDIPRQARELYLASRVRLIPDADYEPAPLVPADNPLTGRPTDLSLATLRSVSPVHLRYMRNMGTPASMSISIVVRGRLWGLISCHHPAPRFVAFEVRAACEQLAQILALRIGSREDLDEYEHRLNLRRTLVSLLAHLSRGPEFIENMRAVSPDLLRLAGAGGAALMFDGRVALMGDTPDEGAVRELIEWIGSGTHGDVFHTDALSDAFPEAARYRDCGSGLLAIALSRMHRYYLLWFRPEVVQTIDWAGNPHLKAIQESPGGPLTPRASFETWREELHGRSVPWRQSEIETALEFRGALLEVVLERAEAIAALADELTRANKELEAFSYSVSHDLRAPLRHIVGFSDLLLEMEGEESKRLRFLRNIKDSARFAGKLVDDLLSFSQMGRASLHPSRVDLRELVDSCIVKLSLDQGERRIDWRIGPLPEVEADPTFLQLAVYNLLSNAVKYTGTREQPVIEVFAEDAADEHVIGVRDNGVGFNMDYVHKLFGVFQRLHRMEDFQGTGIGLANVRRIIERHGGRVWAEGAIDQGATFRFAIPKQFNPA